MKAAHRKAHAWIWTVLAIALPVGFVAVLLLRPLGPIEPKAVPLDETSRAFADPDGSE